MKIASVIAIIIVVLGVVSYYFYSGQIQQPNSPQPEATTDNRCIITISSQQYDVTSFRSQHKGGDIFKCGADMTEAFNNKHGQKQLDYISQFKI